MRSLTRSVLFSSFVSWRSLDALFLPLYLSRVSVYVSVLDLVLCTVVVEVKQQVIQLNKQVTSLSKYGNLN